MNTTKVGILLIMIGTVGLFFLSIPWNYPKDGTNHSYKHEMILKGFISGVVAICFIEAGSRLL